MVAGNLAFKKSYKTLKAIFSELFPTPEPYLLLVPLDRNTIEQ